MLIRIKTAAVVGLLVAVSAPATTGALANETRYRENNWRNTKRSERNERSARSKRNTHRHDFRYEREHVEERARSQRGTPYRSGGTSPNGFDCSGFTRWVFSQRGPSLPHSSSAQFSMGSRHNYTRIWKRSKLEVGDLVFHDTGSGRVGHAGIYIGDGRFISSTSSRGVSVESLSDGYWGPRWVGATRTPLTQR